MPLDCTICTVRFGNGAAIAGTITITAHLMTEVPGKLAHMITECDVEVRGTAMRSIAAVPTQQELAEQQVLGHRFSRSGSVGFLYPRFPPIALLYPFTL
jgi:hypothetical protein